MKPSIIFTAFVDSMQKAYDWRMGSQGIERCSCRQEKGDILYRAARNMSDSLANLQARMDLHEKKMDERLMMCIHMGTSRWRDDPYFAPWPSQQTEGTGTLETERNKCILTYIKGEIVHTLDAGTRLSLGKKKYDYSYHHFLYPK